MFNLNEFNRKEGDAHYRSLALGLCCPQGTDDEVDIVRSVVSHRSLSDVNSCINTSLMENNIAITIQEYNAQCSCF